MLTLLAIAEQAADVASGATTALERLGTFGALGIICAWLLYERFTDRKADRLIRKQQFDAISENTKAVDVNTQKTGELVRVLYLFVGRRHEDTPPELRRPKTDPGTR